MAAKPLKLKRERAKTVVRSGRYRFTAEVLIDHELTHLDKPFSYGVPTDLLDFTARGSRVIVPFNGHETEGIVTKIQEGDELPNKPILKVLSSAFYGDESLQLADEVSKRYATTTVKVLRHIPGLGSSRFDEGSDQRKRKRGHRVQRRYLSKSSFSLDNLIEKLSNVEGDSILLVPTEREAALLHSQLHGLFKERVVKAFGRRKTSISFPKRGVIVGTRGAVFLQVPSLDYMVIFHDSSEHFWSERNPYWNVRDVALLRSRISEVDIDFVSGFPSAELSRLMEIGYLHRQNSPRLSLRKRRRVCSLPDSYHGTIRDGLKNGSVLVQVAHKDYSSLVICQRCRSRPLCDCGFPLKMANKEGFTCTICGTKIGEWKCKECGSTERLMIGRGAKRIEEELGKAFPRVPIFLSTKEKPLDDCPEHGIIVATPGMQPSASIFSALVLLDGELQLNRPTMRAEERLLDLWFSLIAQSKDTAPIFVSLPSNHRVTQAIAIGSPNRLISTILAERKEVKLPPWYRVIRIKSNDLSSLQVNLHEEFNYSIISRSTASGELLIRVPVDKSQEVIDSILSLVKYRLALKKETISVEIDPHDL